MVNGSLIDHPCEELTKLTTKHAKTCKLCQKNMKIFAENVLKQLDEVD